eukprot:comp24156_c0_seq1/m.43999 comp24156_c0_seq1/g.43999  ORF comp24156_c0_seq1/g.43999 comp24156_c0_seq1/m.43999 type:complete len:881 (-) comp24156_c0_seq1:183-2825(-)
MLVVDVDLFGTSEAQIATLKSQGHIVICYYSAGSLESGRPDTDKIKTQYPQLLGKKMNGWPETWLNILLLDDLKQVMSWRLDQAKAKGCHGVEPDNVDCWANQCINNQPAQKKMYDAQLAYNKWTSNYAHSLGLTIGLKNNLEQIKDLLGYYDFMMNESCFDYNECYYLDPFNKKNKSVFVTVYQGDYTAICKSSNQGGYMTKTGANGKWSNCFKGVSPLPPITWVTTSNNRRREVDENTVVYNNGNVSAIALPLESSVSTHGTQPIRRHTSTPPPLSPESLAAIQEVVKEKGLTPEAIAAYEKMRVLSFEPESTTNVVRRCAGNSAVKRRQVIGGDSAGSSQSDEPMPTSTNFPGYPFPVPTFYAEDASLLEENFYSLSPPQTNFLPGTEIVDQFVIDTLTCGADITPPSTIENGTGVFRRNLPPGPDFASSDFRAASCQNDRSADDRIKTFQYNVKVDVNESAWVDVPVEIWVPGRPYVPPPTPQQAAAPELVAPKTGGVPWENVKVGEWSELDDGSNITAGAELKKAGGVTAQGGVQVAEGGQTILDTTHAASDSVTFVTFEVGKGTGDVTKEEQLREMLLSGLQLDGPEISLVPNSFYAFPDATGGVITLGFTPVGLEALKTADDSIYKNMNIRSYAIGGVTVRIPPKPPCNCTTDSVVLPTPPPTGNENSPTATIAATTTPTTTNRTYDDSYEPRKPLSPSESAVRSSAGFVGDDRYTGADRKNSENSENSANTQQNENGGTSSSTKQTLAAVGGALGAGALVVGLGLGGYSLYNRRHRKKRHEYRMTLDTGSSLDFSVSHRSIGTLRFVNQNQNDSSRALANLGNFSDSGDFCYEEGSTTLNTGGDSVAVLQMFPINADDGDNLPRWAKKITKV